MAPIIDLPYEAYSSKLYTSKPASVETVILILALTVKSHYQSIVGRSYSTHSAPPLPLQDDHQLP